MANLIDELSTELTALKELGITKEAFLRSPRKDGKIVFKGATVIDFTCWDALGINDDPSVRRAIQTAIEEDGFNAGSARFSSGTTRFHEFCEKNLAKLFCCDSAALFLSLNQVFLSLMSAILTEQDVVILDELAHGSVVDAAYLVNADFISCDSGDIESITHAFESAKNYRRKIFIMESLNSRTGEVYDIAPILLLCEKFKTDLVVDETSAIGLIGDRGLGVLEGKLFGKGPLATVASLSKGVGMFGAMIAGSGILVNYIISRARSYSTDVSLPPPVAFGIDKAMEILELRRFQRQEISLKAGKLRFGLFELGLLVGHTHSNSPIVALQIDGRKKAVRFLEGLLSRGFLAEMIPAEIGKDLYFIRFILGLNHSDLDITILLQAISDIRNKVI